MKLFKSLLPVYLLIMMLFAGATVFGSHAVTAVAEHRPVERSRVFVIDAGHGGEDGGTVSCTGVHESRINLEIAKKLDSLLRLLGCETVMTRQTDQALSTQGETIAARKLSDLKNRVSLVNKVDNGILVSIHQNQFSQPQYAGPQVFWGKDGQALGNFLQTALNEGLRPEHGRKAKKAGKIYLMEHVHTPAVLVECGFLSNPREESLLRSKSYQQKVSVVLAAALAQYKIS